MNFSGGHFFSLGVHFYDCFSIIPLYLLLPVKLFCQKHAGPLSSGVLDSLTGSQYTCGGHCYVYLSYGHKSIFKLFWCLSNSDVIWMCGSVDRWETWYVLDFKSWFIGKV